jgi:hypothetical protein
MHCAVGGVAITVGIDTNGNGVLDAPEIALGTHADVCDGDDGADGA